MASLVNTYENCDKSGWQVPLTNITTYYVSDDLNPDMNTPPAIIRDPHPELSPPSKGGPGEIKYIEVPDGLKVTMVGYNPNNKKQIETKILRANTFFNFCQESVWQNIKIWAIKIDWDP